MVKEILLVEKLCKLRIVVRRWGPERGEQVTERGREWVMNGSGTGLGAGYPRAGLRGRILEEFDST